MGNCLKCGNKTHDSAVFCDDCQAVMEEYPVKPGAVAYLLPRPKRTERKPVEPQEAIIKATLAKMRRTIRWLTVLSIILSVLVLATTYMLIQEMMREETSEPPIGKNYTTTQTP